MLVQVKDLQKDFNAHTAVKKVSFTIEKGNCIALLGPNGAGKTTTLQMLAGLLSSTSGSIQFTELQGKDYRLKIGFLPQHPSFFNWMTPVQFLQFAGELSNIRKQELKDKIEEVLQFVSLSDVKKKRIGGFSGGMKQRLGLAQALLHDPELLILDEPVSALDPAGRRDVLTLIHQLKERMTILFSTHVLHDAEQVCDKVIMLKNGEIKWDGTLDELRKAFATSAVKIQTEEQLEGKLNLANVENIHFNTKNSATLYPNAALDSNKLLSTLIENGLTIHRFEKVQDSLEDAYMKVMEQ
ncbi:ABC transporter ATP-binding protein [Sutcliffiella sp. NC1]|uniref:ABC transporter ATP-binding protein n=1 Tax=Sutcliffiella sp. NC1 TaxID=3004096 RepID=UPI0022DD59C5|nr:ABC transporter ATP-binding protein [Sutcliffiella sp. NC1]WBL15403.1 ABC transporter ATP-binding protein [Sutcliffiella sp. NC1]